MNIRDDAIFLAGFISGTYDLKGEALPPACVQKVIDRIMAPEVETTNTLSPNPVLSKSHVSAAVDVATFVSVEDTVGRIKGIAASDQETDAESEPISTEQPVPGKKERKKIELTPEEAERRSQRMKNMWTRRKAEKEIVSSIPEVTSMIVPGERPEKQGNFPAPSKDGA